MEYRYLGKSGLKISALSFGAWVTFHDQVGEDTAYACMKEAFDAGVNFFDNAEAYAAGNAELMMGNIIKKAGWKRSD
ncbi:MAG: aldo/keto reductase, partial [Ignavibacteria bacterium]